MSAPEWTDAFADAELAAGELRVLKAKGKRIAVMRTDDGEVHAISDQCPHEGYPLVKGDLSGCVLTCKWHNFKFDVRDGRCLMGDEPVRTFPIRVREARVEVDVSDPSPELAIARLWPSLERAVLERKLGQVARDVVRLLALGVPPRELTLFAARFDARYAEWGTTHVMPVALDVLAEAERRGSANPAAAALPLLQAFDLAADSHTRRPLRPVVGPLDPGSDPVAAGERLAALIEGEDAGAAEALVRGALARGWRREVIEPWLYRACCAHFLDFGHALIYQVKLFDLLERCEWAGADELIVSHLIGIISGTREDTLPEWSFFSEAWSEVSQRQESVWQAAANSSEDAAPPALLASLLEGDRRDAIGSLTAAFDAGLSLRGAVNAISQIACERLLRFDPTIDASVENQHDWLDVTHTLTFANALRAAIERYRDPRVLRAIYFGARFANVTRALDRATAGTTEERRTLEDEARSLFSAGADRGWDRILGDQATRPIVVGHLIKLLVAAREESVALDSQAPLLAFTRVLGGPIRERRVGRLTHEAIRLVVEGKVPRTLY